MISLSQERTDSLLRGDMRTKPATHHMIYSVNSRIPHAADVPRRGPTPGWSLALIGNASGQGVCGGRGALWDLNGSVDLNRACGDQRGVVGMPSGWSECRLR